MMVFETVEYIKYELDKGPAYHSAVMIVHKLLS